MAWALGARLHALTHRLLRPSEAAFVRQQWHGLAARFDEVGLASPADRSQLIDAIAEEVCALFPLEAGNSQLLMIRAIVERLFDYEKLFLLRDIDWSRRRTIAELWDIREELTRQQYLLDAFVENCALIGGIVSAWLSPIYDACPALLAAPDERDGITVPTQLLRSLGDVGEVVEDVLIATSIEELEAQRLLPRLRDRLERNLIAASGGNPADPAAFKRAPRYPRQFDAKTPEHMVSAYLGGTPLAGLFEQELAFTIPTRTRFEHHHIVAGSGHGKTQTLQYLIAQDLAAMERERRSIIVLDSQGDLIRNIAQLEVFAPGGPLQDKLVLIDPTDVEYPVSLNLFDVGQDRLSGYAPLERERLTNSILELYDFVLGTLLDAQMTQKQNVIFRYVTRLMLHIPDATIHTLRELMEAGSEKKFAPHIAKLQGSARHFFETEFASREFEQTRKQVLRRLWGILENQTFERMFSHPRSKLDLFSEMNAGKVILINTAKDLLKEQGTQIFGRFFIALIAQAAQERAVLGSKDRAPTFVYIDEAQDYFDRNIGLILAQARKYNVGMVLAHQYLGQLEPKLQEAFAANTAIKFAGGVSAKDARSLAPMLYCEPSFIEEQGKGSFAAHIRGVTKHAVPLAFPLGYLEGLPVMPASGRKALRDKMRAQYGVHHSKIDEGVANREPSEPASNGKNSAAHGEPGGATGDDKGGRKKPPGHVDIEPGEEW